MRHEPRSVFSDDLAPEVQRSGREPFVEKLAYKVSEAAHALAISRSRLYELIGAGEIKILKDGGRTLIRRTELEAFLERLEQAAAAQAQRRRPSRS